ncbi:MAG: hypothetical protein JWM33_3781 [Caulobacteraceae bacterium]|nr:hypothetical protein [Caulobacteraceae bacterium]
MLRFLAAVALVLGLTAAPALAAPTFPSLTGRVVDDANILPPQVESDLTGKLASLEASSGRQLVVVTLPSLQNYPIEEYGYQLGRAWGIGEAKADNGVLLIVAPTERKVRIEVGYGLEPILTDTLSTVILQTAVLPKFKAGDMPGGVVAGTEALIQQLSLPDDQAKAQVAAAQKPATTRGGAGLHGIPFFLILIVLFFVFGGLSRRRRGGGGLGGVLPGIILGSALSNLDRHDGGGWGGGGGFGGGGGGGFGGGGGSFGGGGSSGGW